MISSLTLQEAAWLHYDWIAWARPDQLPPPGFWRVWLLLGGRGSGKTRPGAEWVRGKAEDEPGCIINLVGRTAADVRDVMITGESGILSVCPPWNRPDYQPSNRLLVWPNGSTAHTFSADEPASLRGPQCHYLWGDEWASWRYLAEAWRNANLGLRLGRRPQGALTTTPKGRPELRTLIARKSTKMTRASTFDNAANLPASFLEDILAEYGDTTIGRQELFADLLDDAPGALWKRQIIEWARVSSTPDLGYVAVGVDPPITATGAECGIVAGGSLQIAGEKHAYVLEDASTRGSPKQWGSAVVEVYHRLKANVVVAEANQGGDMVRHVIESVPPTEDHPGGAGVKVELVHASRGKSARADPVVARYEQKRVHHVGNLALLEDQMCQWEPDTGEASPDRLDAAVWLLWRLLIEPGRSKTLVTGG